MMNEYIWLTIFIYKRMNVMSIQKYIFAKKIYLFIQIILQSCNCFKAEGKTAV